MTDTIVTLTLNPALDVATSVERVEPWRKLRCAEQVTDPGGGGVNVARVVQELGGTSRAVVALGGHVGRLLEDELHARGVPARAVDVAAPTRQNFSVTELATGQQFRFVQSGEALTEAEWRSCVAATVAEADAAGAACVVASSSVPAGVPVDVFAQLATELAGRHIDVVVDTSGDPLRAAVLAPTLFVKPSVNELRTLIGRDLADVRECEVAARTLLAEGSSRMIVVSLGAEGALFVPRHADSFTVRPPAVDPISSIGAGDSMVAALTLALRRGLPLDEAGRFAVAAGTAAVLAVGTGLCRRSEVERLVPLTRVEAL